MIDPSDLTDVAIRVECTPTAHDDEGPIRLIVRDPVADVTLTELKFTPIQAQDSAWLLARLLRNFISEESAQKIANGMRLASIRVRAMRN